MTNTTLDFHEWLLLLHGDAMIADRLAHHCHALLRVSSVPEAFLAHVYLENIEPSIDALLAFSEEDPEWRRDQAYWHGRRCAAARRAERARKRFRHAADVGEPRRPQASDGRTPRNEQLAG